MKNTAPIITTILLMFMLLPVQAIEFIDKKGSFDSKTFDGKIYNDRGRYTGMITPEGKMYDADGKFTGQIKSQAIVDHNGEPKGYIREGKIYDQEGNYKGRLKR